MATSNALMQTRVSADVRAGLDDVRIVLTRVANEGALRVGSVVDTQAGDAWFRAKVQEALNDPWPAIPHDKVTERFAKRRMTLATLRNLTSTGRSSDAEVAAVQRIENRQMVER